MKRTGWHFKSTALSLAIMASAILSTVADIPSMDALKDYQKGADLYDKGDYNAAVAAFKSAIAKDSKNAEFLRMMGLCARRQENDQEALSWFKKAVEADGESEAAGYARHSSAEIEAGEKEPTKESAGASYYPGYYVPSDAERYYIPCILALPDMKSKKVQTLKKYLLKKSPSFATAPDRFDRIRIMTTDLESGHTPYQILAEEDAQIVQSVQKWAKAALMLVDEYKKSGDEASAKKAFTMVADSPFMRCSRSSVISNLPEYQATGKKLRLK